MLWHLCVLIYIWTKGKVGARWNPFKHSSKIFLLAAPRRCFFCGSFMLFLSCFCYTFVRVGLLMPCGHMLGKGWPLSSRLWCLIVKLPLSHWYRRSGEVLGCIDSWYLSIFLLTYVTIVLLLYMFCDSSSRWGELVCSVWLWYFLIILTSSFPYVQ